MNQRDRNGQKGWTDAFTQQGQNCLPAKLLEFFRIFFVESIISNSTKDSPILQYFRAHLSDVKYTFAFTFSVLNICYTASNFNEE